MKLPAFLYGSKINVKRACRRAAKRLGGGEPLEAVVADAWVDTAETPGLIFFERPGDPPTSAFYICFLCDALVDDDACRAQLLKDDSPLFDALLLSDWGCLCLLCQPGGGLILDGSQYRDGAVTDAPYSPKRRLAFLERIDAIWPQLEAIGPRFSVGIDDNGYNLTLNGWPMTNLSAILVSRGVAADDVRRVRSMAALHRMIKTCIAKN